MRKVVVGMLVLGLTSLGFSQESQETISTVKLRDVTVSSVNVNYLQSVSDKNTPKVARELQEKAASYNVKSKDEFDKREGKPFEVMFKATNGNIVADYNRDGEILATRENFKNVALPLEIRKRAMQGNEGWKMVDTRYVSMYQDNDITDKFYKIKLKNQSLKKNLVIDLLND